ncbi:MAG: hypothetical protein PHQ93_04345 [Sulfurimonas sp.]|uniref:hypothetical protein n=1 Tax=Sulfurimonas sp. TaxID=2022749 RepID=UPI00262D8D8A|nr:hypothetical protein [Sulfurimonas sp.]MDD5400400.1 hypothetical protein [Sulfurimonas sp.]
MIEKIISRMIPLKIKKQLINFKILALEYGQYGTIKNWDCIDKNNNKIPWYTYPAIEYLNNIDFSQKSIFEYGSGNSSIFWSNKAKSIVSIEHDKVWYEKVSKNLKNNQILLCKANNNEYENSITTFDKKFDVIVIDGIRRVECSKIVEHYLNKESDEGYMIILDNSDWYKETSKYFRENLGLIEVDFHGFGPINDYTWTTSMFLSRNFNFKPIDNEQPNFSIAADKQNGE